MFETLSNRLEKLVSSIRGKAIISESDIDLSMREFRIALLEADVALSVVKDFINNISKFDDELVRQHFIQIKGVGNWTVDMFLLFTHGSSNIFPSGDLGFIKAISKHYKKDLPLSDKTLRALYNKWSPFSSIATWYLWRSLDPITVSY